MQNPIARCWDRLGEPQRPADAVLDGEEEQQDPVPQEADGDGEGGDCRVQPVVVCRCDDDAQHEQRVHERHDHEEDLRQGGLADGPALESVHEAGVIYEGTPDDERVGEMQTRHRGELVDGFPAYPDALCVLLADGVVEAVGVGEQSRRHAGVEAEDEECGEVAEGHGPSRDGKGVVVFGGVVVPAQEPEMWSALSCRRFRVGIDLQHGSGDVDKRVNAVEEGHDRLVSIEEK